MKFIRRKKNVKFVAMFLLLTIMTQVVFPVVSFALTAGPSQPEIQSFEPVGTTEMVDLFTGDFTYNIPLFELPGPNGGYPFNLHYNAGITADQEASWVGLGWNINPGAITRQMRGLPDEFNGQQVTTKTDIKPNVTFGMGLGTTIEIFGSDLIATSLGLSVYYNNYKGVGYSVDPSIKFGASGDGKTEGVTGAVGINASLDSQEGVGLDVTVSLSQHRGNHDNDFNIGIGYNSSSGLKNVSVGFAISANDKIRITKDEKGNETWSEDKDKKASASMGGNSTLSFSGGGYSPSITLPMQGRNASLQFRAGGELFGAFPDGYISGFFNTQYLKDRNKDVNHNAYGYMFLHKAGVDDLLDFNREKDGTVRKNSPNIGLPIMNCDIYSVSGQGVSGMFRLYRNDVGILFDKKTESKIVGGGLALEPGAGNGTHLGGDLSVNYSKSTSQKWEDNNLINGTYSFKESQTDNAVYEPAYFKSHGEMTSDNPDELEKVGGEGAVRINLLRTQRAVDVISAKNELVKKDGSIIPPYTHVTTNDERREPRNMSVQPVNEDYTFSQGLYTINPSGMVYRYAQPVYNTSQVECLYTAGPQGSNVCAPTISIDKNGNVIDYKKNNTDEFYSKKTIPEYAHSFLLTEILGPDYIDADNNGIPSDGDFGYWVKFTYQRHAADYKWRAPFTGATYNKGLQTTFTDDKGAYTYGTKEVYYLREVSTKSHIAIFNTTNRKDARGAFSELQNASDTKLGGYSKKLDNIKLYSKPEYIANSSTAKPIKTMNFQYSYELCKNLPNNDGVSDVNFDGDVIANQGGKLTLKSVYFTYENNMRGRLSPYVFEYNSLNPNYVEFNADRWGYYRNASIDACKDIENPYVNQYASRALHDANASAWSLTDIKLPSGGKIKVDYEADDYAYVQNKTAMQMTEIASLYGGNVVSGSISHPKWAGEFQRRVYFNLESPIPDNAAAMNELAKYFDNTGKLYYKVFMDIRKNTDNGRQDYVSGYVDVESKGLDPLSKIGNNFTKGYVVLGRPKIGNKSQAYHPFSLAAWQYIRTMNPNLNGFGPYDTDPNTNKSAALDKIKSLASVVLRIKEIFQGFYNHCYTSGWGENIILGKSFIRLNSPDKIKIGGGVRVKQITLSDEWSAHTSSSEPNSVYGQVYDYTMSEEGGISSGVASYEPMLGGDETALRRAKEYPEKIPLKTNNNLFFEYPVNESYYPGASVGYRKVTVKSLATHYANTSVDNIAGGLNIPSGILTTGATTHEFYTAKDFPVITDETPIKIEPAELFVPVPLVGATTNKHLTASQGYSILLNDMHGKPKKVSTYKQDKNGVIVPEPASWIKYRYGDTQINLTNEIMETPYFKLNNEVKTLVSDKNGVTTRATRVIGQDYEFFTDMRQMITNSESGGVKVNTDIIILGPITIPAIVPWPSFNYTNTEVYLAATNKIIHRAGILMSTEAFTSEGSHIVTKNILFDNLTGQPLLTTVTNDFEAPIFNYDIPGHFNYDGLGPAYKSVGIVFSGNVTSGVVSGIDQEVYNHLAAGDILKVGNNTLILNKKLSNGTIVLSDQSVNGTITFKVIRSGRKNMTAVMSGNIKTLGDKSDIEIGDPTLNKNRYY